MYSLHSHLDNVTHASLEGSQTEVNITVGQSQSIHHS